MLEQHRRPLRRRSAPRERPRARPRVGSQDVRQRRVGSRRPVQDGPRPSRCSSTHRGDRVDDAEEAAARPARKAATARLVGGVEHRRRRAPGAAGRGGPAPRPGRRRRPAARTPRWPPSSSRRPGRAPRAPGPASPAPARSAAACRAGSPARSCEPSTNSTIECTTDCGCTTTSMRSNGMSNSRCASMTSRPLFIRVAELIVTTGPMSQVGWASACSGVTSASSARVRPRNGPPLAVRISRRDLVGATRRAGTGPARSARSPPARSARARPPPSPAARR